ncbi:hypothetical protein DW778_01815 [Odoribacter splanchnicus]|nr:hypothetical protein B5F93_19795 [Odoribacter splanchnicus]RHD87756.1 hypothetical protein DW778_01815 [Odoribacter splanchnicus]
MHIDNIYKFIYDINKIFINIKEICKYRPLEIKKILLKLIFPSTAYPNFTIKKAQGYFHPGPPKQSWHIKKTVTTVCIQNRCYRLLWRYRYLLVKTI